MISATKKEIDGEFSEEYVSLSERPTRHNRNEVRCGTCGTALFATDTEYDHISRAISEGLDNPVMCEECRAEYEELAHRER